ncbi:TetR/AcrR family transcriptional regulator [Aeromicrobium sp. A1-2]|uniref:TetR/AcrR family transcriptional regulator n=1 Tax=Aeromicrobium sp. A1-2 TaxID=2107713 RepID=UPI000E4F5962|nr:TetR/AcrR family transcriptional regulator [Aeromicrobium sp. A1-2]AXT84843.1 TetR/AcrR family transcriptional regulator [Aeromicrobium sp. A1-2]
MDEPVKTRSYTSTVRAEQAEKTRGAILAAARALFVERGYRRTTVQLIAQQAGVNVDTIYQAIGRKPDLMRELVETSLSGRAVAVPARQREYVRLIREAPAATDKIDIYARAITDIHERMAPIFIALRDAASTDEPCRALWRDISARRARNMLEFAADLRATGELRDDLGDQRVADVIWSMNAAEYWVLLVQERGWAATEFERWISDAWRRLLLRAD